MEEDKVFEGLPESKKSELMEQLDRDIEGDPVEDNGDLSVEDFERVENLGEELLHENTKDDVEKYGPNTYSYQMERAGKDNIIGGFNYNYEYMEGASNLMSDDLHELQAQAQPGWDQTKRGLSRLAGEFVLNVLETPGVVGGAMAAAATGDVNDMTNNFWMKAGEALKEYLHENNQVYSSKHVRNAGVFDKMTSGEWLATEGASALAFMTSALVPGLAVGKMGKSLGLARAMAKGGKGARWAISQVDKASRGIGLASAETVGLGQASAEMGNLVTTTMVNTVYEAGIEGMGAQKQFQDRAEQLYMSGKIDKDQYFKLIKESDGVAARTFAANVAILVGPNMVMSRMMIGPRGNTLSKASKQIHRSEAGTWLRGAEQSTPKGSIAKALNSKVAKTVGNSAKRFGENTFREGIWEEGAQSTATSYLSDQYMDSLLSGEDNRSWIKTYMDVLGSTDGQIAALTGGILAGPMSIYSNYKEGKSINAAAADLVNKYNSAENFYSALRDDKYVLDENNDIVMEEVGEDGNPVSEPGTGTMQPKVDVKKAAAIAEAKQELDMLDAQMQVFLEKGEEHKAAAIAQRQQARTFAPFLINGEEGMKALEQVMKESPATAFAVKQYNKEKGTNITLNEYVDMEMTKARAMADDIHFFNVNRNSPTTTKFDKSNNIRKGTPEAMRVDLLREMFNGIKAEEYMISKSVEREYQSRLDNAREEHTKLKDNNSSQELISEKEAEISKLEKDLEAATETRKSKESSKQLEKDWEDFYAKKERAEKINNEDMEYDINATMSKLKGATTTEQVDDIMEEAINKGLILPEVSKDKLPETAKDMMRSTNIVQVYAGAVLHLAHADVSEAARAGLNQRVEALFKSAGKVAESLASAYQSTLERGMDVDIERQSMTQKVNKIAEDLDAIDKLIQENTTKSGRAKRNKAAIVRKLKADRAELKRLLIQNDAALFKLVQRRMEIGKELANLQHVFVALNRVVPNKAIKDFLEAQANRFGISIEKEIAVYEEFPVDVDTMIKGFEKARDLAISSAEDLGVVFKDVAEMQVIDGEMQALIKLRGNIESSINELEAILRQLERKGEPVEAVQEQLDSFYESINDIAERIDYLKDIRDSQEVTMNKNVRDAVAIVQTLEDIYRGDYNVEELTEEKEETAQEVPEEETPEVQETPEEEVETPNEEVETPEETVEPEETTEEEVPPTPEAEETTESENPEPEETTEETSEDGSTEETDTEGEPTSNNTEGVEVPWYESAEEKEAAEREAAEKEAAEEKGTEKKGTELSDEEINNRISVGESNDGFRVVDGKDDAFDSRLEASSVKNKKELLDKLYKDGYVVFEVERNGKVYIVAQVGYSRSGGRMGSTMASIEKTPDLPANINDYLLKRAVDQWLATNNFHRTDRASDSSKEESARVKGKILKLSEKRSQTKSEAESKTEEKKIPNKTEEKKREKERFNNEFAAKKIKLIAKPKNKSNDLLVLTNSTNIKAFRDFFWNLINYEDLSDNQVEILYAIAKLYPNLAEMIALHSKPFPIRIGEVTAEKAQARLDKFLKEDEVTDSTVSEVTSEGIDKGYETPRGIKDDLTKLFKETKKKLAKKAIARKIKEFNAKVKEKGRLWADLKTKEGMVKPGDNIYWTGAKGVEKAGFLRTVIAGSQNNGTNVLVEEASTGQLYVLSGTAIRTTTDDITKSNEEVTSREKKVQDKEKRAVHTDGTQKMAVFTRGDLHGEVGESDTFHPTEEGKYIKQYNPFLRYLEEARDKTKDKVTFGFVKKNLDSHIFKLEDTGKDPELLAKLRATREAYDFLKEGEAITDEQKELLYTYMPMKIFVRKSDGTFDTPQTYIKTKPASNDLFDSIDKQVRKAIITTWLANGAERIGPKGQIPGVEARWDFQYKGRPNVDNNAPKEGNRVDQLKDVTLDNIKLFMVTAKEKGKIVFNNRKEVSVPFAVHDKVGGVFIQVKDNTGELANVRLRVNTLADSKELDILMSVIETLLKSDITLDTIVPTEIMDQIKKEIPQLYEVFQTEKYKDLKLGTLYNTLLYSGTEGSQFGTKLTSGDNSTFAIGPDIWNEKTFAENKDAIRAQLGFKYKNVKFPSADKSSKIPDVSEPAYLKYLIETKAIATNLKTDGEAIFVGGTKESPGKSRIESDINVYLSPKAIRAEVKNTEQKQEEKKSKVIQKAKENPTKEGEKKVVLPSRLTAMIKPLLSKEGYKTLMSSNKAKQYLIDLGKTTRAKLSKAIDAYNQTVTEEDIKAGDTKIEKC